MKSLPLEVVKNERLYMKVADQLRKLIENDVIAPGQRFPSERELAEQLGVNQAKHYLLMILALVHLKY